MLNTLEQDVIIICLFFGIHSIFKYLFVCVSLNVVFIAWKRYKRAISTLKKIKEDWLYEKTELNLESQILMTNKISRHSTARQNFWYQNGPLNKKFGHPCYMMWGFLFSERIVFDMTVRFTNFHVRYFARFEVTSTRWYRLLVWNSKLEFYSQVSRCNVSTKYKQNFPMLREYSLRTKKKVRNRRISYYI